VKNWRNRQKQLSSREKEVTQAEKGTSKIVFINNTNKTATRNKKENALVTFFKTLSPKFDVSLNKE
jgi:hypothetical protein